MRTVMATESAAGARRMAASKVTVPDSLGPASRIRLFETTVVPATDGKAPLLGCERSRAFVEVEPLLLLAVDALRDHGTIELAEQTMLDRTGEALDLTDLVRFLAERGFVEEIDGVALENPKPARERHPWLHALEPHQLKALQHPIVAFVPAALAVGWMLQLIADPGLRPQVVWLNLLERPSLILVSTLAGSLVLSYLHELCHFFMARSFGIDATISVSHRFLVPVLQTDVTNAWRLPKAAQLRIFLAGIAFNVSLAAGATTALALGQLDVLPLDDTGARVLQFVCYLNIFPLIFQLFIFARTDLYHVLVVTTGSRNLYADSKKFLAFRAKRVVLAARGQLTDACATCGTRVHAQDPFCMGCGATLANGIEGGSVSYAQRHFFLAFGAILLLGSAFAYYMIFTLLRDFVLVWLIEGVRIARAGWSQGSEMLVVDGVVAVIFALSKLCFSGYFLVVSTREPGRRAVAWARSWLDRWRASNSHPKEGIP